MLFISILDATKNGDRIIDGRLIDHDFLHTSGESRILFDVFSIFIERGGTDAVEFASGEHRLEDICRIQGRIASGACTDNGVDFIDEENDSSFRGSNFLHDGLEPLFEFTAVFRARDERPDIQFPDRLVLQGLGNIAFEDTPSESFDNGGLSDTWITDQNRVVLALSRENLHDSSDFVISSDDGINLAGCDILDEVSTVFLQGLILNFRIVGCDMIVSTDLKDGFLEVLLAVVFHILCQFQNQGMTCVELGKKKMLHGHIVILHLLLIFGGIVEDVLHIARGVNISFTCRLYGIMDIFINLLGDSLHIDVESF